MTPPLARVGSPYRVAAASGRNAGEAARQSARSLAMQQRLMIAFLVATDAVVLLLAFELAFWLRFRLQFTVAPEVIPPELYYQNLSLALVPLWLVLFAFVGLYEPLAKRGGSGESARAFQACTVGTMLVIVGTFFVPEFVISRMWLVCVWLLAFAFVAANRLLARRVLYACRRRGYLLSPAAIVGTNQEALSLASYLADVRSSGIRTLGFLATQQGGALSERSTLRVLGSIDDIAALVKSHDIKELIVAITAVSREELLSLCERMETLSVHLRLSSGLYELLTTRVSVQTLAYVPFMTLHRTRLARGEAALKRAVESVIAGTALFVLSPLLLAIAIAIKHDSPGPILHRRRVLGASGRQFDAFKFRTMHLNGDELLARTEGAAERLRTNHKLRVDPRVTSVGQWLRKYSLDELPQLFNVLLGQMAVVGPRMISPAEAVNYGRHRLTLFAVKPGITGLWQVSGRSDLAYEERVRFDMYYVRNYSIWLDLQILFQTIPAVLGGRGAY